MTVDARWAQHPLAPLLLSSVAAALTLSAALWGTQSQRDAAWQDSLRLAATPERVAESFVVWTASISLTIAATALVECFPRTTYTA